jgi:STE24 endopeptidase
MLQMTGVLLFFLYIASMAAFSYYVREREIHHLNLLYENIDLVRWLYDDLSDAKRSILYQSALQHHSRLTHIMRFIAGLIILFSLPFGIQIVHEGLGFSHFWNTYLLSISYITIFMLLSIPISYHRQFHIEKQFDFLRMTKITWIGELFKKYLLTAAFLLALLFLFTQILEIPYWWLIATLLVLVLSLLSQYSAVFIRLFSKLTPYQDKSNPGLVERIEKLGFKGIKLYSMNDSNRSKHRNAFLFGFPWRLKIVLFDTLLETLNEGELKAVLFHELGHKKAHHLELKIFVQTLQALLVFGLFELIIQSEMVQQVFRLTDLTSIQIIMLLTVVVISIGDYIFLPVKFILNAILRRLEFVADRYAADQLGDPSNLLSALRKLHKSNRANPLPEPLYGKLHFSHPGLLERIRALELQG